VIEIRECGPEDVARLDAVMPAGDAHAHHYAAQQRGEATYLVAWVDGEPAGSGVISWTGCHDGSVRRAMPDAVEIHNLGVRPEQRGRGIGTSIVAAAERLALARGVTRVAIGVSDDNSAAARLYERLGYHDSGLRSTAEYTYTDATGTHHAVERNILLVKTLRRPVG